MSGIKIERMNVKNTQRGKAYLMARFDVNLGALTIKGFELVQVGDKVFVSEPYNLWKPKEPNAELKRFTYVFFNGEKGQSLKDMISNSAKDEYRRRNQAPQQDQNAWGQQPEDILGGDGDDGLPF